MSNTLLKQKANFGTAPVFMTAISTILGAILYLRFGYAVAHTGFMGAIAIISLVIWLQFQLQWLLQK